jgi:hypothetical protein
MPAAAPAASTPEVAEPPREERALPDTRDDPPPAAEADRAAAAKDREDRMLRQAKALHAVRFAAGRPPELLHPAECAQHAYSCPFTHAAVKLPTLPRPGRSGTYECRLNAFGLLAIGQAVPLLDTTGYLTTTIGMLNGRAYSRS